MTSESLPRMTKGEWALFNALIEVIKQHNVGMWELFGAVAAVAAAMLAANIEVIDRAGVADKFVKWMLDDVQAWQHHLAGNPLSDQVHAAPVQRVPLSDARADRVCTELAQAILDLCGDAGERDLPVVWQMQAIMEAAASIIVVITEGDDAKVDRIVEDLTAKLRAAIRIGQAPAGKPS